MILVCCIPERKKEIITKKEISIISEHYMFNEYLINEYNDKKEELFSLIEKAFLILFEEGTIFYNPANYEKAEYIVPLLNNILIHILNYSVDTIDSTDNIIINLSAYYNKLKNETNTIQNITTN